MAEVDYDGYGAEPRITRGQAQRLINIAGALCSVALIIGVGLWGYRLAVRDVSGVPVIRAAEGPMRVAPSNPGGSIADHQGMAVNMVAAVGGATDLPEEIVLAPAPADLAPEDGPGLVSLDVADAAPVAAPPALPLMAQDPVVAQVSPDAVASLPEPQEAARVTTQDAVALALAEALSLDPAEVPSASAPLDVAPETLSAEAAEAPSTAGVVRPMPRPASVSLDVAAVEPVSAAVSVGPELDSSTLQVGTRLVQLGAFDTADIARAEWSKLRGQFGDLMNGKSLVVQSAVSGGRTFYRLRAHGFGDEDDARRFCAALLAENAACIPVAHR